MKSQILLTVLTLCSTFLPMRAYGDFTLQLNDEERATIYEIISEVGERSLMMLFFRQRHMNHLGDSVRHVPPLQFLGFVLSDHYLRSCLQSISNHPIKWSYFIDGFGKNMDKEVYQGRIFHDLPGFATLVESDYEKLLLLSHQREWDNFVRETL